jgi:hypothetical protein
MESEQEDSFFDDEDLNNSDFEQDEKEKKEQAEDKEESGCLCRPSPFCVK